MNTNKLSLLDVRHRAAFIIAAALAVGGCRAAHHLADGAAVERRTILLAGQSNMVRFSQYAEDAFRRDYAARVPGAVAVDFVPCAVGGTYSGQWLPDGQLFDGCLDAAAGKKITGILYYQGESDAYLQTTNWTAAFGQTVNGFREHFGNVPVVFAQIAITTDPDFARGWDSIQAQQAAVKLPGVAMIQTADVAALVDTVHLTPESLCAVADRFAAALVNLEGGGQVHKRS